MTDITADDIATSVKALTPADQAQIQNLAAEAAAAGADPATVAKIAASTDFNSALTLATPSLGAKVTADKAQQAFQDKISQEQVNISQENATANLAKMGITVDSKGNLVMENLGQGAVGQEAQAAIIKTPNGNLYANGTGLSDGAKQILQQNGYTVLEGDSSTAVNTITNIQTQLGTLITGLQGAGAMSSTGQVSGAPRNSPLEFKDWTAGAAVPALNNFSNFVTSLLKGSGQSTDFTKLPNTGSLAATLQNNIPTKDDSPTQLQKKLSNITNALNTSENSFLASGSTPQEGQTGTVNGVTYKFINGNWVSQ